MSPARQHALASVLLTSFVLLGSACKDRASTTTATRGDLPPPRTEVAPQGPALDQQFIDFMVPQQERAVMISRIALERAEHPELKELARELIADQEPNSAQLKGWRREWFGSDVTPPWDRQPTLPGASDDLPKLGPNEMAVTLPTVKPFDNSYLGMMILHYRKSVRAAELAAKNASHSELKELASKMADRKKEQLARLEALHEKWYPQAKTDKEATE